MASADFPFNSEITTSSILARNNNVFGQGERFTVRGSVMESDTRKLISDVNIEVNGGGYATTGMMGDFKIEVRVGDELTIRHKYFDLAIENYKQGLTFISNGKEIMVSASKKAQLLSYFK